MNATAAPVVGIAVLTFVLGIMGLVLLVGLMIVLIRNPAHAAKIIGGVALSGLALVLVAATFFVGIRQSRDATVYQPPVRHGNIEWQSTHDASHAPVQPRPQRITEQQEFQQRAIVIDAHARNHDHIHSRDEGHGSDDGHGHTHGEPAAAPAAVAQNQSADDGTHQIAVAVEHPSNLLWARQQASDAPAWANTVTPPDSPFVVVSTDPYATEEEATRLQLTPRVVGEVTQKLRRSFPEPTKDGVPVEAINRYGVREIVREEFQKDFGLGKPEPMYKLHARVEITPELKQAVHQIWKRALVKQRLWQFGGATGLGVLVVAVTAGFLRLNAVTLGRARNILAVVLAASAIGMVLLGVLFLA